MQCWSTDAAPAHERLEYWIDIAKEQFVEMDVVSPDPRRFGAELVSAPLNGLKINRVRGSAQHVFRTARASRRSHQDNYYYLLCKVDSAWSAAQEDRHTRLLPGDLLLVDSRRPYEFRFESHCDALSIEMPIGWVERWMADAGSACGCRLNGQQGFGAALSAFVRALQPEISRELRVPSALLTDQLGALLALTCGEPPAGKEQGADLRRRIEAAIREQHIEPGLTAATVAQRLGIGERTLHRALAGHGATFAKHLLHCRIDAASQMLSNRRFDRLTVAEIGRRVGLLDPSHFVRLFRMRTGHTPAVWRSQRRDR